MRVVFAAMLLFSASLPAQTGALSAQLKQLAFAGEAEAARDVAERARGNYRPDHPELLEALSWVGRAGVVGEDWEIAEAYGMEVYEQASRLAAEHGVDASAQLATALGAAIEVLGKAYDASGDRARAAQFLHEQRDKYRGTSIETRIQKNFLLISIEGKPMPPLAADRFIGQPTEIDTAGKVAVFYFWAHWCADCKAQKPALLELQERYAGQGLAIVAPTHLFGYAVAGRAASEEEEIAYLEGPWQRLYGLPDWMPKPLSQENWSAFGVSTTPTIVIADRAGIVRLYHPGKMTLEELEAAVQPLLDDGSAGASSQ
ncbi:MAG: TlpA family protein disulfide reductase [Bryobacterales bacterium]|nr:TlpA family protein disulfide reductase [Bryobacterales bacterium]